MAMNYEVSNYRVVNPETGDVLYEDNTLWYTVSHCWRDIRNGAALAQIEAYNKKTGKYELSPKGMSDLEKRFGAPSKAVNPRVHAAVNLLECLKEWKSSEKKSDGVNDLDKKLLGCLDEMYSLLQSEG